MSKPEDQNMQMYGLILDDPKPSDLWFGANDRVPHKMLVPNGNWMPYYSPGELQKGAYYDTMGCVSFSANKIVEAHLNYAMRKGLLSDDNLEWLNCHGYIETDNDGIRYINLSDRFTTAMSGTGPRGNNGGDVWWSVRNNGVVPEKLCPWNRGKDVESKQRYASWYRNPDNIPLEVKVIGEEFVKRFEVFYERENITSHAKRKELLYYSPLQVFIPTACPYDRNIQQSCGATINHAVALVSNNKNSTKHWSLFDHYIKSPHEVGKYRYIRKVASDYNFYANAFVCTIIEKNKKDTMKQNDFVRIVKDENSPAHGFFLPAHSEQAMINLAALFGKQVPVGGDGKIDWSKLEVDGQVKFDRPLPQ